MPCAVRVLATTAKGQRRLEILGCGAYTVEEGGKAQTRKPPTLQPSAAPRACVVLASCLRHACNEGTTTRAPPPPPTHTSAPPGVRTQGRRGEDG